MDLGFLSCNACAVLAPAAQTRLYFHSQKKHPAEGRRKTPKAAESQCASVLFGVFFFGAFGVMTQTAEAPAVPKPVGGAPKRAERGRRKFTAAQRAARPRAK